MTPEEQKTKCEKCPYSGVIVIGNFKFLRCAHKPYKNKLAAEIEKCPKEEKRMIQKPTMKETLKHEQGRIFPSDMSERTLTNIAHYKNILEALEKQIPQKPILEKDPLLYHGYWNCPSCDSRFGDGCEENLGKHMLNYCHVCGQAIDWEEVSE